MPSQVPEQVVAGLPPVRVSVRSHAHLALEHRAQAALTEHGWEVFRQAESRYSETERDFTATLGDAGAAGLRQAPRSLLSDNGHA